MATFMTIRAEGEGVLGKVMQESEVTVKSNEDICGMITGAGIKNITIWDTRSAALDHVYDTNQYFMKHNCYAKVNNDGAVIYESPNQVEVEHIAATPESEYVDVLAIYDKDHFKDVNNRTVLKITQNSVKLNEHAMDGLSEKDREAAKEVAVAAMNRYGYINNAVWRAAGNLSPRFKDWDDMTKNFADWDLIKESRADASDKAFTIDDVKRNADEARQGASDKKKSDRPLDGPHEER